MQIEMRISRGLHVLAILGAGLAGSAVAVAGGGERRESSSPGRQAAASAWPAVLKWFRELDPSERLRLVKSAGNEELLARKVERGVVRLEIVARGSLEAARSSEVVCTLRAPRNSSIVSTIKWVIDAGAFVKKGDKLIDLDDSGLREQIQDRALRLQQARAEEEKTRENLKRVQTENEIDVRLAEIDLRLAELQLQRDKGADAGLTEERQLKVEQGRLGVRRAKARAQDKEAEVQAELLAKKAVVDQENARKNELAAELAGCVLRAPQDGLVVYYVPEQIRGGGQQSIIAQGEPVREGQKLLLVSDLKHMQVNVRVAEAQVPHLRPENSADPAGAQRALILVDAFPQRWMIGHVQTVSNVASQLDWFASDVKVFKTVLAVDAPQKGHMPGMSAEVHILAEQTGSPVLHVPLQSVATDGRKQLCFVLTDKDIQERAVTIGLANEQVVEIRSGLAKGERILFSPRTLLGRLAPAEMLESKAKKSKRAARGPAPAPVVVRSVRFPEEGGAGRSTWVAKYGLTPPDLERIQGLPTVVQAVPVRTFANEARRLARTAPAQVVATTPAYADLCGLNLAEGRFLSAQDDRARRNVVVLGAGIADQLFPGEEALGRTITLAQSPFIVIGVLREEESMVGRNETVYLAMQTCQARFGERIIVRRGGVRYAEAVAMHSILVAVREAWDVPATVEWIQALLEQTHAQKDWGIEVVPAASAAG